MKGRLLSAQFSASSSILRIDTARVFKPLLGRSRYKGAFGGRGSGKSHFFADLAIERCLETRGTRVVCVREVQRSLKESVKLLLEDKLLAMGVGSFFRPLTDSIVTPGDGIILFQGMQDHTAESIKSLEGFDIAYAEEAQTMSRRSLEYLRPTIRKPQSELWFSWNPRNANDPVDLLFRGGAPPSDAISVKANYQDNPFFTAELEAERQHDLQFNRERYGHIWLGDYEPAVKGAIWDRATLQQFRRERVPEGMGRIVVAVDPAVSSESGADEHGIIVVGIGADKRGYVLADVSARGTPRQWASRVIAAADRWGADAIVAEINQGGEMVRHTIDSVRPGMRVIEVKATRGKHVRAEPISALYALGQISHVGTFAELEDQMCKMSAGGYEGNDSPDRVDALVWGLTELFPQLTPKTVMKPIEYPRVRYV